MKSISFISLSLIAAAIFPVPLLAQQSQPAAASHTESTSKAISLGYYRAAGDFGLAVDTTINYLPLSFELDQGNWGLQLLTAQLEVAGPGAVLINLGGVNTAVAGSEFTRQRGIGDTVASVLYRFDASSNSAAFFDLRLDVKLPTASEQKGLGTGETDYSLQLDVSQQWQQMLLFGSLGYTLRGKSELFQGLRSGAFLQIGAAISMSSNASAGVFYDYREAASDFAPESHELSPYISWQMTDKWSLTGLLSGGFTDASPQWGFYTSLRYSW